MKLTTAGSTTNLSGGGISTFVRLTRGGSYRIVGNRSTFFRPRRTGEITGKLGSYSLVIMAIGNFA